MSYQMLHGSGYVPCPRCRSSNVSPVNFNWWGGALGPRLLSLVKCNQCQLQYKGKTGGSPNRFIAIYLLWNIENWPISEVARKTS
jgi:hypothetical protein